MLDMISGGRLVAGFPMGLSYDANLNNGIPPVETRARYREAHELVLKAWTSPEAFSWNGRYSQYRNVNIWPRPLQQPHPPVWIPGAGTPGTMRWTFETNTAFVYLSFFGPTLTARRIFDRFWGIADELNEPRNPYRLGFVQVAAVAETDARAEHEYGPHLERAFRQGLGSIPAQYFGLPGYIDKAGVEMLIRDPGDLGVAAKLNNITFKEIVETQCAIVGSPATVRDQISQFVEEFRIGNLIVLLQLGGMPHELAMKNISMFGEEVLPHLQKIWESEGWEHHWWPQPVSTRDEAALA
jgi:alkanesulfonate monooxygenase SsuD/methylene tetrahydromethanopterin reductase-like flavin-dependent oxidoreductase (luciferase family)